MVEPARGPADQSLERSDGPPPGRFQSSSLQLAASTDALYRGRRAGPLDKGRANPLGPRSVMSAKCLGHGFRLPFLPVWRRAWPEIRAQGPEYAAFPEPSVLSATPASDRGDSGTDHASTTNISRRFWACRPSGWRRPCPSTIAAMAATTSTMLMVKDRVCLAHTVIREDIPSRRVCPPQADDRVEPQPGQHGTGQHGIYQGYTALFAQDRVVESSAGPGFSVRQ